MRDRDRSNGAEQKQKRNQKKMASVMMKHTHVPGEEQDGEGPLMRAASNEALSRKGGNIQRLNPLLKQKGTVFMAGGLPSNMAFPLSKLEVNLVDGSSIVLDDNTDLLGGKTAGKLYTAQQYMRDKKGYAPLVDWCKKHTELLHGDLPGHEVSIFVIFIKRKPVHRKLIYIYI